MRNGLITVVLFLATGGCATNPPADSIIAQDVTCMAAAADASAASDPMERNFSPIMLAYYFGRLEQAGLRDDDIEARVEKVARDGHGSEAATFACGKALSGRLSAMHAIQKQNLAKLQAGARPEK